jgi:hypothetical protein
MKANKNNVNAENVLQQQYKPVKPFAFEAWKIWNNLTSSAESLWEEYQDDFIEFCCQNTHLRRKKMRCSDDIPF